MSFKAVLEADIKSFTNNIDKAVGSVDKLEKTTLQKLSKVGDSFVKVGAKASIFSAAVVGATVGLVKMGIDAGNASAEINNLSTATSLSTDLIQELSYVATASNSSFEGLQSSMDSFQRRLKTVGEEGSRVNEMFGRLGVSTTDASGNVRSMDDVLLDTFNKLGDMEEGLAKNAIGAELFGRSWNEVALIVSSGSKGIAELRKEANKLGLVLDENILQSSDDFSTAMGLIGFQLDTLKTKIGASLVPILQETVLPLLQDKVIPAVSQFADFIAQLSEKFNALSPSTKTAIFALGGIATAIAPVLLGLGGVIKLLPLIGAGFTAITSPVGIAVAAVAGLTAGIIYFVNRANEATTASEALAEANKRVEASVRKEKAEIEKLLSVARDETKSKDMRLEAIRKLNSISKEYLGSITLETVNTDEAKNAVNDYTTAIERNARQKAISDKISKLYAKQLEYEEKIAREAQKIEEDKAKGFFRSNILLQSAFKTRRSEFQNELDNINESIKAYESLSEQYVATGETGADQAKKAADDLNKSLRDTSEIAELDTFQKLIGEQINVRDAITKTTATIEDLQSKLVKLQLGILPSTNVRQELAETQQQINDLSTALDLLTGGRELNIDVKTNVSGIENVLDNKFLKDGKFVLPEIDTSALDASMGDLSQKAQAIKVTVGDVLENLFADASTAIMEGDNVMTALASSMLGMLGGIMVDLGKMALGVGIGLESIKEALKSLNPALAIGAGVALIALGSLFSAGSRKLASSMGGGGGGYSSAPSLRDTSPGYAPSEYRGAYQDDFKVEFKIGTNELVGVLNTAEQRRNRIG